MHILQCALVFSLLGSGSCRSRGLKRSPDSSEAIRLVARTAEMAHRKFIEPMGVRRQEETRIFHWRDDSAYIPRQNSIPAKIWMTVPDKATISTDVQVETCARPQCSSPCESHKVNVTEPQAGLNTSEKTSDTVCHAGKNRNCPFCEP